MLTTQIQQARGTLSWWIWASAAANPGEMVAFPSAPVAPSEKVGLGRVPGVSSHTGRYFGYLWSILEHLGALGIG